MAAQHGADVDAQYGLSRREIELLKHQAAQRAVRRQEFLKNKSNPAKYGQGGYLFDPAYQRFLSVQAKKIEYFKTTPHTSYWGILFMAPFFICGYIVKKEREMKERAIRTGTVAYRDRLFKFI